MSLPLLALRTADLSAPLPATTIQITLDFYPTTHTDNDTNIRVDGPSALMQVIGYEGLSANLQAAAQRLSEWIAESVIAQTGILVNATEVSRQWSMTWGQFSQAIALYTCPKLNTSTPTSADKEIPYILSKFNQQLLGDDGRQVVSMTFAIYENVLRKWILRRART